MPLGVGVVEIPYHGPCTVLREGPVVQLVPGQNPPWQPRTLVLTKDVLGFRLEGSDTIHDHVALADVTSVEGSSGASNLLSYAVVAEQEKEQRTARSSAEHGGASARKGGESSRRFIVNLFTEAESRFHGRSYPLRFDSNADYTEWYEHIKAGVSAAKDAKAKAEMTLAAKLRKAARAALYSDFCQLVFGALICTCMRARVCVRARAYLLAPQ